MVFVQRKFLGERRAIGRSMTVGMIIFSIVEGLGCVDGRSHVFE